MRAYGNWITWFTILLGLCWVFGPEKHYFLAISLWYYTVIYHIGCNCNYTCPFYLPRHIFSPCYFQCHVLVPGQNEAYKKDATPVFLAIDFCRLKIPNQNPEWKTDKPRPLLIQNEHSYCRAVRVNYTWPRLGNTVLNEVGWELGKLCRLGFSPYLPHHPLSPSLPLCFFLPLSPSSSFPASLSLSLSLSKAHFDRKKMWRSIAKLSLTVLFRD